jgi:hypothetical protein
MAEVLGLAFELTGWRTASRLTENPSGTDQWILDSDFNQ